MKIALVYKQSLRSPSGELKEGNKKAEEIVPQARDYLKSKGIEIAQRVKGADYIVAFGGDGTIIHKSCEYVELGIPLIGINTGNLGFLAAAEARDWQGALDKIIDGKVLVSERITIEATVSGKKEVYRAINEAVIKGYFRVTDLEISVENEKFLKLVGDGLIIAAQTGSTAYALSAGGPIIDPHLDCLLLTPINSTGLPIPPVLLSPKDNIFVKVTKGNEVALVLDGQEHTKLTVGDTVKIGKGKYNAKLGYFDEHHFIKALNAKFGLATRQRS